MNVRGNCGGEAGIEGLSADREDWGVRTRHL